MLLLGAGVVDAFKPVLVPLPLSSTLRRYAFSGGPGRYSSQRGSRPYPSAGSSNQELLSGKNFGKVIKLDPELRKLVGDMPFSDGVKALLTEKGFESMTPIQSQCYESIFAGEDVIARSRTGTGKTFAFGIPLIERVAAKRLV
jgi:ATP-dependent helicase YprA (DUF1998 family)